MDTFHSFTLYTCSFLLLSFFSFSQAGTVPLPSYPLAVRSPYLSAWLPGNVAQDAPTAQPQFWNGQNLTWSVLARVDNTTYSLLGLPNGLENATAAKQTGIEFTSTHTKISLTAGNADFVLDFFSPVSPNNYVRQSLPYSYLSVNATPSKGSEPVIQVLSAIDDTWTAQSGHLTSQYTNVNETMFFNMSNPQEIAYTELADMATWGSVLFASESSKTSAATYMSGSASNVYSSFVDSGSLENQSVAYAEGNLYAFAHDLGSMTASSSALFAVGHDRISSINFLGNAQSGYYRSEYPYPDTAVPAFFADYAAADAESQTFDQQVVSKASAISGNYSDILEASVRQSYGAMEIAIPSSTLDTSSPQVFLKEISSDGNVNTVDVVLPTFPILYVLSPSWIRFLLQPYLTYMNTGAWPYDYIVHDMGSNYPNATGHNLGNAEQVIIDATGGFFELLYAYQLATNESTTWLAPYQEMLNRAADYLVSSGLYPVKQLATVDAIAASANQTALGMASAIGLKAYGTLSKQSNYSSTATSFANTIYNEGLGVDSAKTHFTYNYGVDSSWGTTFTLYPDQLLELNTFPAAASAMQSKWYASQYLPNGAVPFCSMEDFTVSEWAIWAGASSFSDTSEKNVQEESIDMIHAFLTSGINSVPFPTKFAVSGDQYGVYVQNKARSTVGSMWAPLALEGKW